MNLEGRTLFVSGGTGSMGYKFISHILLNHNPKKIIIFSRDEYKQSLMSDVFYKHKNKLRFFVGNIRDYPRLVLALNGVDTVIHAAALKQVPSCEYNPQEAIRTNIDGTWNIIRASIENSVENFVFLSTDKAVNPINLYGATKLVGEKLVLNANYFSPVFKIVRYGNVMGARGSVIDVFKAHDKKKPFPITDPHSTRFWMGYDMAINLVLKALDMPCGMTLVAKAPSFKVTDLAKAFYMRAKFNMLGLRPGEKRHETLINIYESSRAWEFPKMFAITPEHVYKENVVYNFPKAKKVGDFKYKSDTNNSWLKQEDIRKRLEEL